MAAVSIPLPDKVRDEVMGLLQQAIDKLAPFNIALTDPERKSLGSVNMGTASVAFAQHAGTLLAQHATVLRRSITDEMIAAYPTLLNTFSAASLIEDKVNTLAGQVANIGVTAGASVMGNARMAYTDGQNDKGKDPGVAALIGKMAERFAHLPSVVPPLPATKP